MWVCRKDVKKERRRTRYAEWSRWGRAFVCVSQDGEGRGLWSVGLDVVSEYWLARPPNCFGDGALDGVTASFCVIIGLVLLHRGKRSVGVLLTFVLCVFYSLYRLGLVHGVAMRATSSSENTPYENVLPAPTAYYVFPYLYSLMNFSSLRSWNLFSLVFLLTFSLFLSFSTSFLLCYFSVFLASFSIFCFPGRPRLFLAVILW